MHQALPNRPFEVTHRSVVAIALPMTFAYMSTPLLGIVDTAVIGQLGDPALLGGIAVGAILFDIIFATCNFLRSGTTGLVAQAYGAGDSLEMRASLVRALMLAAGLGGAIIALQVPIVTLGLTLMGPSTAVAEATTAYLLIRIWSAPFGLANYAMLGWFLGLGKSGTGLVLQLVLNGVNIVLSVVFVLGLGWGIAGVAWGTVIGEAATALAGALLVLRHTGRSAWPSWQVVRDLGRFRRLAALNGDIMVRSFVLLFAFSFFTAQGARYGDVTLAANAVLMNFFMLAGYFLDGFAIAAEQLAGRAVGARWRPAFRRTVWLTLLYSTALAGSLSLVLYLAGPRLIDFLTTAPDVRGLARHYLLWAALTPVAGMLAFLMDGIFIGATWSRDMRNMMLISVAVYLACWWVLTTAFGVHGLWLALLVFLGARGLSLAAICPVRMRQAFG